MKPQRLIRSRGSEGRLRPLGPPLPTWTFQAGDEPIVLTGEGAMVFPERALAMVADLHLGKTQVFRSQGLAVPEGSDEETLGKLERLFSAWPLQQLVILGDLIHHEAALDDAGRLLHRLKLFRERWPRLGIHLVLGNHDKALRPQPQARTSLADELLATLGLECHSRAFVQPGLSGHHEPPGAAEEGWQVSGHLHPAVRVYLGAGQWQRLACFTRCERHWQLPAFGAFTGGFTIVPAHYHDIVALAEGQLLALGRPGSG